MKRTLIYDSKGVQVGTVVEQQQPTKNLRGCYQWICRTGAGHAESYAEAVRRIEEAKRDG